MSFQVMTLEEQRNTIIETLASGVESTSVDGMSVKNASVDNLIKADKYLAQIEARQTNRRPFRIDVLRAPGAVYGS